MCWRVVTCNLSFGLNCRPGSALYVPDVVCGDLDSASEEALSLFAERGTHVHKVADQDTTDLWKCLAYCHQLQSELAVQVHVCWTLAATDQRPTRTVLTVVCFACFVPLLPSR